jgi:hypothetical protein
MACVASKLSRAALLATTRRLFAPRLPHHDLAGDTTFTIWTRPLFVCANGATVSPFGPRFLRRGLADLPASDDPARLPVGAADPQDL